MKNIYGAFGSIGSSVSFVNGRLFKTTKKEGYAIHGFDSRSEMLETAGIRGHKILDECQATNGEWVYSV